MNPFTNPVLAQSGSGAPYTPGAGLGGLLAGPIAIVYLLLLVGVLFASYRIAVRLNVENAWLVFTLIGAPFVFALMAGKEWWWGFLLFIPIIGFFISIYLWMCTAENLGHPSWMGLLMIIPLVNIALMFYWAFGAEPAVRY